MTYKVIGLMSGSSLDGLDIVFAHIIEARGKWTCDLKVADCLPYDKEWEERLRGAAQLSAIDYCQLDADYGHYLAEKIEEFVEKHDIHMQMDLIASHGHTVFHKPLQQMTAQIGDGAAIAAKMNVAVVSHLRNFDVALGGQGAPLVPLGEKLLFPEYKLFLNFGGIANISFHEETDVQGYDICPANSILNALAEREGYAFDEGGKIAASGVISRKLLQELNSLPYYKEKSPKSLGNDYGKEVILPLIDKYELDTKDKLATYVAHIVEQVEQNVSQLLIDQNPLTSDFKMLVTGGGAYNHFLIKQLKDQLQTHGVEVIVPEKEIVEYKEAIVVALLGALRWRENNTTLPSVTGASRASIGGALWMGQEGW